MAERILIVDDEERIRKLLVMYLEKEGYIVCDLDKSNLTDDEIEKSQILILSMYSYLKAVEESYGKYVEIRVREV